MTDSHDATTLHADHALLALANAYSNAEDALERASLAEWEAEDRAEKNKPPMPDVLKVRETDRLALGCVGAIADALKHYAEEETISFLQSVYMYEGCSRPAGEIARAREIVDAYGPYIAAVEAANAEAGIPSAREAWERARDEAKRLRAELIAIRAATVQGVMAKAAALWKMWGSTKTPGEELAFLIESGDTDAESLAGLSVIADLMALER